MNAIPHDENAAFGTPASTPLAHRTKSFGTPRSTAGATPGFRRALGDISNRKSALGTSGKAGGTSGKRSGGFRIQMDVPSFTPAKGSPRRKAGGGRTVTFAIAGDKVEGKSDKIRSVERRAGRSEEAEYGYGDIGEIRGEIEECRGIGGGFVGVGSLDADMEAMERDDMNAFGGMVEMEVGMEDMDLGDSMGNEFDIEM